MRDVGIRLRRVKLAGQAMLLIAMLSGCSAIHQVEIDRRIDQMIGTANSPADHEAIAAAYEEEAARNREQAAAHLKIAQSYEGKPHVKFDYSKICRQMAQDYSDVATKDAELAAEHRGIAKQMRTHATGSASP